MTEEDLEYLEETFVTFLSDGKEFELEKDGRKKKLTAKNKHEYIEKTKEAHLAHLRRPFELIRRGIFDSIFTYQFYVRHPLELEQLVSGMDYVIQCNPGGHRVVEEDHELQLFSRK